MSGAAIQRRSAVLEVRAKGRRLEGYAALFGVRANIAGVEEEIRAGAFASAVAPGLLHVLQMFDESDGKTPAGSVALASRHRNWAV